MSLSDWYLLLRAYSTLAHCCQGGVQCSYPTTFCCYKKLITQFCDECQITHTIECQSSSPACCSEQLTPACKWLQRGTICLFAWGWIFQLINREWGDHVIYWLLASLNLVSTCPAAVSSCVHYPRMRSSITCWLHWCRFKNPSPTYSFPVPTDGPWCPESTWIWLVQYCC